MSWTAVRRMPVSSTSTKPATDRRAHGTLIPCGSCGITRPRPREAAARTGCLSCSSLSSRCPSSAGASWSVTDGPDGREHPPNGDVPLRVRVPVRPRHPEGADVLHSQRHRRYHVRDRAMDSPRFHDPDNGTCRGLCHDHRVRFRFATIGGMTGMRSWMHYIVENREGEVAWYTARRGALLRRRHPYAEKGLVKLASGMYTVNPQYFRRRIKRRWTILPWPKEEHVYAYFAEGVTTEIPFFRADR